MRFQVPWPFPPPRSLLRRPSWWRWPVATLKVYLILVIVMATVPLGILTSWLIAHEIQTSRQQLSESLQGAAGSLAQVIDREQLASAQALNILANAEPFVSLDASALQRLLHKLPQVRPSWNRILLMDADGRVLMRSDGPGKGSEQASGAGESRQVDPSSFARPRFTDLVAGKGHGNGLGAWTTRISVPVVLHGRGHYVLAAEIDPGNWQTLIANCNISPVDGYAAVFDSRHKLIARAWHAGRRAAVSTAMAQVAPASEVSPRDAAPGAELGAAEADAQARGLHKAQLPDGSQAYAAWQHIAPSGWGVSVGVSAAPMDRARMVAIASVVGAGILSVGLGIGLSLLVARRVNEPLLTLVSGGPKALQGEVVVHEIALLREAMEMADSQRDQARHFQEAREGLSRAQARLDDHRHLIELAQEAGDVGFFDHHLGSDRITVTSGLARLLGLDSHTLEISVNGWLERIEAEDAQSLKAILRQAWRDQAAQLSFKFRTRAQADAPQRWLSSRLVVTYSAHGGQPLRMIGVMSDVTAQQLIEQERARLIGQEQSARQEAERANRSKDEFLAMLGHELRNPLSAISAAIEVLNRISPANDQGVRVRTIIARQTRHLTRLMDDLLDVARVFAGKIHLASQPVNLGATVQRLVNTLHMSGVLRSHPLELKTEDAWVDADVVRLEQIVNNLVTNAAKYSPEDQPIEVRVLRHGLSARLQVIDHGAGIDRTLLPHIFDLFVQGERTLDRRQGGLGIGLTLVKSLVELHQGHIDVATSDGGSIFTIDLPLREAPMLSMDDPTAPCEEQRAVVVVEDNEDAREALCCMLELKGHKVCQAPEGLQGLARIVQTRPHLALVDIGLPGLSGYEVARKAREAGFGGWLVAVSGYGQQKDVERALEAGFDAYMVKPLDKIVLDYYLGRAARMLDTMPPHPAPSPTPNAVSA